MQITEIEYTPNPNAVKFLVAEQIFPTVGGRTQSYEDLDEATGVPLAEEILELDHVETVFFAASYITVNQDGDAEWEELMREVAEPIRSAEVDDARSDGADPDVEGGAEAAGDEGQDEVPGEDDPRMEEIREILDEEIRPYLQGDGGDLRIRGLIEDELRIDYQGACGSCPASITGTLRSIEHLLQRDVDEHLSVEAVGGAAEAFGGMF